MSGAGVRCEVAAPSKLQRPTGDRVKTDARDARHLARLLRMDEFTSVAIPSVEQVLSEMTGSVEHKLAFVTGGAAV